MTDSFVHLHVASGYSMRYGTAKPEQLVERAAAFGQPALALTDRDGLYGAVKFVTACMAHDVAPVLGVDLALGPDPIEPRRYPGAAGAVTRARGARTPVRGGALVDPRLPRVTVLARGSRTGLAPGAGWAALCRLVTDTHLSGERGNPVTTARLLAEHASPAPEDTDPEEHAQRHTTGDVGTASGRSGRPGRSGRSRSAPSRLVVLLGPDSDVGRAVLAKKHSLARALLEQWRDLLPSGGLVVELVCHGGPEHLPGSLGQAGRMLALAGEVGVPTVITAAVRHADPQDAAIVDVLDAARRLVALDARHLDRVTTAGHLSPTPVMHALARDVAQVSGPGLVGGGSLARQRANELTSPGRRRSPPSASRTRAPISESARCTCPRPGCSASGRGSTRWPSSPAGAGSPSPPVTPTTPVHSWPRSASASRTVCRSSRPLATPRTSSPWRRSATSSVRWGCASRPAVPVPVRSSTT